MANDDHHDAASSSSVRCYVCDTDLSSGDSGGKGSSSSGKKKKEENNNDRADDESNNKIIRPGLVEISGEGTGFAGGGKNLVKREGVAFQC